MAIDEDYAYIRDTDCAELHVLTVVSLTPFSVKVTFDAGTLNNVALIDPDLYVFTPHSPIIDTRPTLQVFTVTPEAVGNPTYVILATAEQTDGQVYDLDIKTIEAA